MIKIKLKKKDAIEFFGSVGKVAGALGTYSQLVSMWNEEVSQASAWALMYVSKTPKHRRKGRLKYEIIE